MAKKFILVTGTMHRGGYRVAVPNGNIEGFKNNPIMLWMHQRDHSWNDERRLPIGRWQNIAIEDGNIVAESDFDMEDEFAAQIGRKVEKGYLNAASAGIKPLNVDYVPNAAGGEDIVISEWEMLEASIVDIPMDADCTTQFYVEDENEKLKAIKNLDELKQAFPKPTQLITNNTDMNNEQFQTLLQAIKDSTEAAKSLKADVVKMQADIDTLKQSQTKQQEPQTPAVPTPPTPAPSIVAHLQQNVPQIPEIKKDFAWYEKNDMQGLINMRKQKFVEYAKLCKEANIMIQSA